MRRLTIAGALLAVLVAGCLSTPVPGGPGEPVPGGAEPSVPRFLPPVNVSTQWPGSEPVIAVASDGTLFVEGIGGSVNKVFRSRDDGATWRDVTPPLTGEGQSLDGFLAVGNGDTVYVANAYAGVLSLWRSDDLGATWTPLAIPPHTTPMHRMWIVPEGEATVHLAVEKFSFVPPLEAYYLRSDDRGTTWSPPVPLHAFAGDVLTGFGSNLAVGPDSRIYWARLSLSFDGEAMEPDYTRGEWYLMASDDGGLTWERRPMFALDSLLTTSWQSLFTDPSGTLYMAWAQDVNGTATALYAFSKDGGRAWSTPRPLAPAAGAQTLVWAAARAPGEVGALWYAADEPGLPENVQGWHVDYAFVGGADTDAPRAFRTRVTPSPVHSGTICTQGPWCSEDENRDLLDYPWIAFDAQGRARLAFANSHWDQPRAFPVYAAEQAPFTPEDA